jgi:hypothetical protein
VGDLFAYQSLKQLSYLCFRGVHSLAKLDAISGVVKFGSRVRRDDRGE